MNTGTNVAWGSDLTFFNVSTSLFDQTPVYDPSRTDKWYDLFTVSIEAIVNASAAIADPYLGTLPAGLIGRPINELIRATEERLSQPRRQFRMWNTGSAEILLQVDPCVMPDGTPSTSAFRDVNNGPRVADFKITRLSPATYHISVTFELARVVCDQFSPSIRFLNNRWQMADSIDEQYRTERVIRGTLRLANANLNPQMFRGIVVPPLQKGWKRTRMNFTGETNGMELGYEIHDREMLGPAPPDPAVKMSCTHTQSLLMEALKCTETLHVRLDGTRSSDKKEMLQNCLQIMVNKLRYNDRSAVNITSLILVDHFGEDVNSVEARMELWRTEQGNNTGAVKLDTFGSPLELPEIRPGVPYDRDAALWLGPYGTSKLAGLFACKLQTACGNEQSHTMPQQNEQTAQSPTNPTYGQEQPTQITYTVGPPKKLIVAPIMNQDQLDQMYEFARLESIYDRNENRVHLPIARTQNANGEGDNTGRTAAIVRLSAATEKRIVKYAAERIGTSPRLWRAKDFTDTFGVIHWILRRVVNARGVTPTGDGKQLHTVDAEYTYGLSRPANDNEGFSIGVLSWAVPSASDSQLGVPTTYAANQIKEPGDAVVGLV